MEDSCLSCTNQEAKGKRQEGLRNQSTERPTSLGETPPHRVFTTSWQISIIRRPNLDQSRLCTFYIQTMTLASDAPQSLKVYLILFNHI